jgi:SAM-dependent methyltransferase
MIAPETDPLLDPRFAWADVERWAAEGLLRPDQLLAIRARDAAQPEGDPAMDPGEAVPVELPASAPPPVPSSSSRAAIRRRLGGVRQGYQQIDLPYGVRVKGKDRRPSLDLVLPPSLAGKSVLDVGAAEGYFSFAAEARGAARVVAVDVREERVRTARRLTAITGSQVEILQRDIVRDPITEAFDYVLVLNVVHHLRDPLPVLWQLAAITRECLVIEFPTLADDRFQASLGGDLSASADALPLLGVRARQTGGGQRLVFSPAAMPVLLHDPERGFATVDIIASPMPGRAIARCYKAPIPPESDGVSAGEDRLTSETNPLDPSRGP